MDELVLDTSNDQGLLADLARQGPINLTRAAEIMDRFGVDGFVVGDPLNVFHLTGYWPQIGMTRQGHPPTTFAILSRKGEGKPVVVTSHFIYYYTFADGGSRGDIDAYLFEAVGDAGEDVKAIANPQFFADKGKSELTSVERRRRSETDRILSHETLYKEAGAALAAAIRDQGLWNGTIAIDHEVIRTVCEHRQRPGKIVPADNLLRWVRMVKSPLEIALMRRGAQGNADAVNAVVSAVRAGADYRDLRRLFSVEAARRGNQSVFMTIDRVSSPLAEGDKVRDGQSLFVDGVSHFQHYHGDYARTVFVGEPTAAIRKEADAAVAAWKTIREALRPGLKYSQVGDIGRELLSRMGSDATIGFGPHSVGLMHTDEPAAEMGGFYGKEDLVLTENMVLSVDCPSVATGLGGSVHIEDLVLITADGAVPIHEIGEHIITV